jgi:hypothetical protein
MYMYIYICIYNLYIGIPWSNNVTESGGLAGRCSPPSRYVCIYVCMYLEIDLIIYI